MVLDRERNCISLGHHAGHLRDLAHEVKKSREACYEAARMMSSFINDKNMLIPIPSHTGDARYTYEIAYAIAILKGAKVADVLHGFDRMSSHEAKLLGKSVAKDVWFYADHQELQHVVLIDNCITTGKTIEEARKALGMPDACALTITNAKLS